MPNAVVAKRYGTPRKVVARRRVLPPLLLERRRRPDAATATAAIVVCQPHALLRMRPALRQLQLLLQQAVVECVVRTRPHLSGSVLLHNVTRRGEVAVQRHRSVRPRLAVPRRELWRLPAPVAVAVQGLRAGAGHAAVATVKTEHCNVP